MGSELKWEENWEFLAGGGGGVGRGCIGEVIKKVRGAGRLGGWLRGSKKKSLPKLKLNHPQ